MASSIPRARRKEYADTLVAKALKVAFFTNLTGYDPLTATTYAALAGTASEVSNAGTGYTTGGYSLTGKSSSNLATNGAIMTADATVLGSATFTAQYGVIYDSATGKIEGVSDWLTPYSVTNGTITITWDTVAGLFNVQ